MGKDSKGKDSWRKDEGFDEWLWRQPWKIKLPIMIGLFVLVIVAWETGLWIPLGLLLLVVWFVKILFF